MKIVGALMILLFMFLSVSCGKKMDPVPSSKTSVKEVLK